MTRTTLCKNWSLDTPSQVTEDLQDIFFPKFPFFFFNSIFNSIISSKSKRGFIYYKPYESGFLFSALSYGLYRQIAWYMYGIYMWGLNTTTRLPSINFLSLVTFLTNVVSRRLAYLFDRVFPISIDCCCHRRGSPFWRNWRSLRQSSDTVQETHLPKYIYIITQWQETLFKLEVFL